MTKAVALILILFFALLQGAMLPINLVLLSIIFLAIYRPGKEVLAIAFLAGLFLDLAQGKSLGISSFSFCVFTYAFLLYSRRFSSRHPLFVGVFTLLAAALINRLTAGQFGWQKAFLLGVIAGGLRLIIGGFALEPDQGIKLRV